QAAKKRFWATWRAEEASLPLVFGREAFVVSVREPRVGDWPPIVPADQPLIDPEVVTLTDLPEPTVGGPAADFWQARMAEIVTITNNLRATRETINLTAALRQALGDPNPGAPLPVNLDTLAQQLHDPNPAVVAAAIAKIHSALFMSVDGFNRVMVIRTKDANTDPLTKPTTADWIELYGILTTAEIHKRRYPVWLTEEANSSTGVVY